jgi:cytochrome c peroxidase
MRTWVPLRFCAGIILIFGVFAMWGCGHSILGPVTTTKEALGEFLFRDASLSTPPGQSCATCHDPDHHFVDSRGTVTSAGAVDGRFGNRNSPTAAYAMFSPEFHFDLEAQDYIGGQFWDGRASNLEEQAKGPFLNHSEMNNDSKAEVVQKVQSSTAQFGMRAIYGDDIFNNVDTAYDAIADAIAAFERLPQVSPFSSKYDAYLAGNAILTPAEARGLEIYNDPDQGNCAACHPSAPSEDGTPPLFTDFSYDNLGLPRNFLNPFYTQDPAFNPAGDNFVDEGLFNTTKREDDRGRFKVPTLRNIAETGPYFHNGIFISLKQVIDFYNQRDTGEFGAPEEPLGVNEEELGNLGLSEQDKLDMIAFLMTLTDGYTAVP